MKLLKQVIGWLCLILGAILLFKLSLVAVVYAAIAIVTLIVLALPLVLFIVPLSLIGLGAWLMDIDLKN
jgi:hypothetical protein